MGEVNTVYQSKMSVANYNNQTYLLYSKYGGDHSDVYGIPIETESHIEALNVYDFSLWDGSFPNSYLSAGTEETNPDNRTNLSHLNLSPYSFNSELATQNSGLSFRFTYTGREFNLETGNYYYRFRIYDPEIGRFVSKDLILFLNRYNYVQNEPLYFIDSDGRFPWLGLAFSAAFYLTAGYIVGTKIRDWYYDIPAGGSDSLIISRRTWGANNQYIDITYITVEKDAKGHFKSIGLHSITVFINFI